MLTNVVGVDPDELAVGRAVRVEFAPTENGYALPRFRPVGRRLRGAAAAGYGAGRSARSDVGRAVCADASSRVAGLRELLPLARAI